MKPKWMRRFKVGDKLAVDWYQGILEVVFTGHVCMVLRGPDGDESVFWEDLGWRKVKK